MEIYTRHISNKIIELTISTNGTTIVEDVTNLNGFVDEDLIEQLKLVTEELIEHNKQICSHNWVQQYQAPRVCTICGKLDE